MISVQKDDFNVSALTQSLYDKSKNTGAIGTFVGIVRVDGEVCALELSEYPGMTLSSLELISAEAKQRWRLGDVVIVHRIGKLFPGEQIVFVGASSEHRSDALEACAYMADQLKTRAMLWKKEHLRVGHRWVEQTQSDIDVAAKWRSDVL